MLAVENLEIGQDIRLQVLEIDAGGGRIGRGDQNLAEAVRALQGLEVKAEIGAVLLDVIERAGIVELLSGIGLEQDEERARDGTGRCGGCGLGRLEAGLEGAEILAEAEGARDGVEHGRVRQRLAETLGLGRAQGLGDGLDLVGGDGGHRVVLCRVRAMRSRKAPGSCHDRRLGPALLPLNRPLASGEKGRGR